MTLQAASNIVNFDPYSPGNLNGIYTAWLEPINSDDWTVDPSVFSYNITLVQNRFPVHVEERLSEVVW
jgi:hypothetical protein